MMAANWAFFFLAIQTSTVAVAVVSLFTCPLISALVEPWVYGERHKPVEVMSGIAVLAGVFLVVPEFSLKNSTTLGVCYGIVAAIAFMIRNLLGRSIVREYGAIPLTLWQFMTCAVVFAPFGLGHLDQWKPHDIGLVVLLGSGLTAFSQLMFFHSLKQVTGSYATLMTSIQPALTVAIAYLVLREVPNPRTLWGGAIILLSVVAVTLGNRSEPLFEPE